MSTPNSNQISLRQVYRGLMAGMSKEDCNTFMQMLCPSQVRFLNQLLPTNNCQLRPQDCDTTVAGSEHDTVTLPKGTGRLTPFLQRLRRPKSDFLALDLRISKTGLTTLSLILPCPCLQRPPRYFTPVVTLKSCPLPIPPSLISLG
ncbi:hypothetical protein DSO57_1012033 [Entomophthora muscae]|uniref:Uncharacterized protein n=1 Tax=Entomophthora muscae TaxID=34485 RepID=A0ACC2RKX8_9FUNG|nr:hypothetical protein DSO57_1012033 [Entomophthora muscae]